MTDYKELIKELRAYEKAKMIIGTQPAIQKMLHEAADAIEELHNVRNKGTWIERKCAEEEYDRLISNYECSVCHSWERNNSDFCPNCGADMRGEEE